MLYLCFSKISWAEGVDDAVLTNCLEDTYSAWIGLFSSIMSTSPERMVGLKIQITKVSLFISPCFLANLGLKSRQALLRVSYQSKP